MGYNRVILMGRLTRDPETRFGQNGTAIVSFGLAVGTRVKRGDNYEEETCFVDVKMLGKRAEAFAKFHAKGANAHIEGELKLDQWEDKQTGARRQKMYVLASGWEFTGKPEGRGGQQQSQSAPAGGDEWTAGGDSPFAYDDTPF